MNNKYIIVAFLLIALLFLFMFFWNRMTNQENIQPSKVDNNNYTASAYFAGGCFWCVEKDFEKLEGVGDVISGYSGGTTVNPTYENHGDHREAVMVPYDPTVVSYEQLVQYYFRHNDGTDAGGSFYDRGRSYTSAISYQNDEEKEIATRVKKQLDARGIFEKPLVTEIESFIDFTRAEEYHQNYYKRDPVSATKYKYYRAGSGRDDFIEAVAAREQALVDAGEVEMQELPRLEGEGNVWQSYQKPSDAELQEILTETQYLVTQKEATEKPFSPGNLDDEKRDGIFVDILSGEPLFSSRDKYDSGTGWPSFTQPISTEYIVTKNDYKLILPRIEVRSQYGDNHIGHVFNDGPEPTGQRWCMNGAAMRFIPLEDMESEGYGDYVNQVARS